jgi:ABC-type phosphate transport system permease subunit
MEPATQEKQSTVKTMAIVYAIGCLLIYFGVPNALLDFMFDTHVLRFKIEDDLFIQMFDAVSMLVSPFLAVLMVGWILVIPSGIVYGVYLHAHDIQLWLTDIQKRGRQ